MVERIEITPKLDPNVSYSIDYFERWERLFRDVDFRGEITLEIGAGQSDITAWFRERGALAFAIDPAYDSPRELDQAVNDYLNREILSNYPEEYKKLQKARERFRLDKENNPEYYMPDKSTALPFEDNTVDMVYSGFCICPVVSRNSEELEQSMSEIIRVLKPEGIAIIFPFDNYECKSAEERSRQTHNLNRTLFMLEKEGHSLNLIEAPCKSLETTNASRGMLFIQKAK